MPFVIRSRCEVEREGVAAARATTSKLQRPQTIDSYDIALKIVKLARERVCSKIKSVDRAIAKISNKKITAKHPERSGSYRKPPRRVKSSACTDAGNKIPLEVIDIDDPVASPRHFVVLCSILHSIRHVQLAAELDDIEWRITGREVWINKLTCEVRGARIAFQNIDGPRSEICGIKVAIAAD